MTPNLYGLTLAVAVLAGFILARKLAPRFGFEAHELGDALPWVVFGGLLGARAYFVLFAWENYAHHFLEIFKIWHGGLSIYGGLIGGVVGALIYAKRKRIDFWKFLDLLAVVAPLGQSIGRWGNFFNAEAFGYPTNLPWKIYIPPRSRPFEYLGEPYFHPAFLYESLWDLAVLLILLYLMRGTKRVGFLAGSYLVLYGLGRFFIESIRLDSFYLNSWRLDQMVSLLAILLGSILILRKSWQSFGGS